VAKTYAKTKDTKQKKAIRRNYFSIQTNKMEKLLTKTDVKIGDEGAGLPEIRKFQQHLTKYKITVYEYDNVNNAKLLFEGPDAPLMINLLHQNKHFNVITSLTSAFACKYYCEECHVSVSHKDRHRCRAVCQACMQRP
jgi:hypothetical protein